MNSIPIKQGFYPKLVTNGPLTRLSLWIEDRDLPFLVLSIGSSSVPQYRLLIHGTVAT
jgi:hypothetical protein